MPHQNAEPERVSVLQQLRLEAGQRFCRSGMNPVVLRHRFLLQLGPPCADITTPGDYEGSATINAALAIIFR
jgi:hypothetical protein